MCVSCRVAAALELRVDPAIAVLLYGVYSLVSLYNWYVFDKSVLCDAKQGCGNLIGNVLSMCCKLINWFGVGFLQVFSAPLLEACVFQA